MRKQTLVVIVTVVVLLLLLGAGNGNLLAGPSTPEKMTLMGNARNAFTYQGRLTDAAGKPLDGQYNMTFQLWDALTNGSQVGNDILVNNVVVENGVFNAIIPVPDSTFNGQAFWLRIKVGDEWLEPRQEIMPVPYAMSLIPGAVIRGTAGGEGVVKVINTSTTGWSTGIRGETNSREGVGVLAINTAGGNAINAWSATTTGFSAGVFAESNSPDGSGVFGKNNATTGFAVGVQGLSNSPNGAGMRGSGDAGGIGVAAESTSGIGLYIRSISGTLILAYGNNSADPKFYVTNDGNVYADGTFHTPAADFAEMLPAHSDLEPGDVLIIGLDSKLTRSTQPYQTAVVGVYSTQPGFLGGAADGADLTDQIPLAIVGIVPVKVSTENGPIYPGDLLTPSAIPGYAMVCQNRLDCVGAIIGKALEPLEEGTGMINVLITLQ